MNFLKAEQISPEFDGVFSSSERMTDTKTEGRRQIFVLFLLTGI